MEALKVPGRGDVIDGRLGVRLGRVPSRPAAFAKSEHNLGSLFPLTLTYQEHT
jgi:hypothetical protein